MAVVQLLCVECSALFAAELAAGEAAPACPFCDGALIEQAFPLPEPPAGLEPGLNLINWPSFPAPTSDEPADEETPMSETLDRPLSRRFDEAIAYALDHHRDHARKGTQIPYAAHLLAVTALVLEMEVSEEEAIAAALHDVIEDGGGPEAEQEITDRFGPEVAAMVRANSDTDEDPKPPWKKRKRAYIAAIPDKPIGAVRVSIADKLHNATAIVADHRRHGEEVWTRFNAEPAGVLRYYRSLVEAFEGRRGELGPGAAVALDRLTAKVDEMAAEIEGRGAG